MAKESLKLVEWDSVKHLDESGDQTEIKGQIVAAISSTWGRYYIRIEGDYISIHKAGFPNDQLSVLPTSANTILVK